MPIEMNRRHFLQITGAASLAGVAADAPPIDIGNRKQLMIDNRFIASPRGIRLAVNPPRKAGVVLRQEKPWERRNIGGYLSVVEDGGVCKMWYNCAGPKQKGHAYAISTDGVRWERPSLGVVEFDGSRDNNLVLPQYIEGAVFLDPVAPPPQRFKLLTETGGNNPSLLGTHRKGTLTLAVSPDGIRWLQEFEVLPLLPDTQNNLFWDNRLGKYVAYLRSWNPQRSVVRCEIPQSDILKTWPHTPSSKPFYLWGRFPWGKVYPPAISTELPTVLAGDERDDPFSDVYTPNVVQYPYADDVYLAFPSMFRHTAPPGSEVVPMQGVVDVHFAASRDGIRWDRFERKPYLGLGVEGETDSQQIYLGLGMIRRGHELLQYYGAYNTEHNSPPKETALMMAVQRLDGFVSANAPNDGGEFVTPPLRFQGSRLELNIDTSAMGEAAVELQSPAGVPLPGYELRQCRRIIANSVAHEVVWDQNNGVAKLQGSPVRLRIRMRNARLFAFQFV